MSEWQVHLVFIDDKSKKFWRAKHEATNLVVNWGRIGTDGQSQTKTFSSDAERDRELDKLADSKRKKGYVDSSDSAPAAPAPAPVLEDVPNEVDLLLNKGNRNVGVRLVLEDDKLRTLVVETYDSPDSARAALLRIKTALEDDGYV